MKITEKQLRQIIRESIINALNDQDNNASQFEPRTWNDNEVKELYKKQVGTNPYSLDNCAVQSDAWATERMNNFHKPYKKIYNGGVVFDGNKFYVSINGQKTEVPFNYDDLRSVLNENYEEYNNQVYNNQKQIEVARKAVEILKNNNIDSNMREDGLILYVSPKVNPYSVQKLLNNALGTDEVRIKEYPAKTDVYLPTWNKINV